MAERSFRVIIQNSSSFLTLNQTFNHLCGGVYTPAWLPPGSIASGTTGGIQSESDGLGTGTEAYVKYDVDGPDGKHGMLYVYWDNPFLGYTHFRVGTAFEDILPDCDYNGAGGSIFGSGGALDFTVSGSYGANAAEGDDITQLGDLTIFAVDPLVGGPIGAIGELIGVLHIDKNPVLNITLSDAIAAPPFSTGQVFPQSAQPTVTKLLTQATPQDWVGQWTTESGNITVDINLDGSVLLADVFDSTADPAITITNETFVPGPAALLDRAATIIQSIVDDHAEDSKQRSAFTRAARNVITTAIDAPHRALATSSQFQAIVGKTKTSTPVGVTQAQARTVGRSLGLLLEGQGGVAYLSDRIVLMLFGNFQSNKQIDSQLLYQRVNVVGETIFSQVLSIGVHVQ